MPVNGTFIQPSPAGRPQRKKKTTPQPQSYVRRTTQPSPARSPQGRLTTPGCKPAMYMPLQVPQGTGAAAVAGRAAAPERQQQQCAPGAHHPLLAKAPERGSRYLHAPLSCWAAAAAAASSSLPKGSAALTAATTQEAKGRASPLPHVAAGQAAGAAGRRAHRRRGQAQQQQSRSLRPRPRCR